MQATGPRANNTTVRAADAGGPVGMPHLAGVAANLRQRMAAHFVDGLAHIVEIGGHLSPVSRFLTRVPESFTCIDPKAEPLVSDQLAGQPCRVRHIDRKFQDVELDRLPASYGLVFVGYSLKPFGQRDPVGDKLFSLMHNSAITVIEYALNLERASSQIDTIMQQASLEVLAEIEFRIADGVMERSAYNQRRLLALKPAGEAGA